MLWEKSLKKPCLKDIDNLIANKIGEGQNLDYKSALSLDCLLKTIGAFANAQGGYILIGIKEDKGFPIQRIGIEIRNQEQFIQKIDKKIEKFIAPAVKGITYNFVKTEENLFIVIIHVPKSLEPFHTCNFNENRIYYVRQNAHNNQLQPYELVNRARQENPRKIVETHVTSRINKIQQGKCDIANVEFQQNPFFLIYAKPISKSDLHLSKETQNELSTYIREHHPNGVEIKPFWEGLYVKFRCHHHLIFHRNGYIEYAGLAGDKLKVLQPSIEESFKKFFYKILSIIDKSQGLSPLLFSYTLNNVKGSILTYSNNSPIPPSWFDYQKPLKRESYCRISTSYDIFNEKDRLALYKDLFDPIWNEVGIPESPYHRQDINL